MSNRNVFAALIDRTLERWPVIAAAILVGALLGAGLGWATQPEPGYTATTTIRYIAPAGVSGAPTADTFVAMALNPSVQATAAAELSVDAEEYAGAVDAAINPRDRSLVVIKVTNADENLAIDMVEALAESARIEALLPAERYAELYRNRIERGQASIMEIEARISLLEQQLAAADLSTSDRLTLEASLYGEQIRLGSAAEAVESNQFTLDSYATTAEQLGQTTVEPATGTEYVISGSLRGAAIGLFIGVLVAGIVARRSRSDAASA